MKPREIIVTADASGASRAGFRGLVVVVVDVIDFSTSMEAALDAGAAAIFGAAPDQCRAPAETDPFAMGVMAGREALGLGTGVVVLAEPRVGGDPERRGGVSRALSGIKFAGAAVEAVIPNLGAEVPRLAELSGRVVLGVSGSGGTAFDAAVRAGAPAVLTGTVARTLAKKGAAPAEEAARRAIGRAKRLNAGIAVVAAGGSSMEDLLAAEYIYKKILELGNSF